MIIKDKVLVKNTEPKFFSSEFHTRVFPALLWNRLRRKESGGTTFVPFEWYIVIAFCLVLAAIGIPYAINHHSIIAWVAGGIGVAGILVLTISSICSRQGSPSYEEFLWGVFFFLVMLGLTAGIFAGTLEHSFVLGLAGSVAGLLLGYVLGIFAGLWFQYLGLLALLLNVLAIPALIGLIVVDLVLLLG
ncbi:MAG: hypothetical protein EG824_03375 [Deltaproteobacteria bacterium]|nr:hypothetical protein [Deltaproteobacteria bacterium]MRR57237.1 hypothetical protein [Deltaproteobacteria bacterium]TLN00838.1 MAG: hypothetical protein FDZ73_18130 [bacterium]